MSILNKEKKRVFGQYSFYDRTHIQQHLEDMATKGWMLEKITPLYWQFQAIEPQALHFSINYFPPASEFDAEPSEQLLTIRDYCAHAGWEFVTANAQMQIYYNKQENPTPIETDALVEVETIHKAMKKNFLPSQFLLLGLAIVEIILQINMFCTNPINYLISSSSFFGLFCWLSVIALCSIEIIGYLCWHKKAKYAAEIDGEFINTPSYRNITLSILWIVILVFVLYMLTLNNNKLLAILVLFFATQATTFFFVGFMMKFLKRKKVSATTNRIVTIAVSFIFGFALMMAVVFGGIQLIDEESRHETYTYQGHEFQVYNDKLPLYIADLMQNDYAEYSNYWEGRESFLLGKYEGFQRPRMDALEEPSLRYDVYYIKWGALYDMCLNALIHKYDDWYEDDVPMEWRDNFRAIDAKAWNANIVYQHYAGDTSNEQYILCYDDIIVYLTPGFELTDAQKLIVSEKLNQPR